MTTEERLCEHRSYTAEDDARDDGIETGPMCGKPARWANCDPIGMPACDEHVCRCRIPLGPYEQKPLQYGESQRDSTPPGVTEGWQVPEPTYAMVVAERDKLLRELDAVTVERNVARAHATHWTKEVDATRAQRDEYMRQLEVMRRERDNWRSQAEEYARFFGDLSGFRPKAPR